MFGLSKLYGYLVVAGAVLGLVALWTFKVFTAGKTAAIAKQMEQAHDRVSKAREGVTRLNADPAYRDELRKRRTRD